MIDNKYLKDRFKDLAPYEPSEMKEGIFLNSNESPFNIPTSILKKYKEELGKIDFNRYPDTDAMRLRESIAKFYNIDPLESTIGVGSDDLIDIILKSTIENKKILTLTPSFSMYSIYSKLNAGEIEYVVPRKNFKFYASDIIKKIKEVNPFITVICSPNNPTGQAFSKDDLISIIEATTNLVIIDEAYQEFGSDSVVSLINKYDNLLVLRTFSKAYSMAALRLGYVISNKSNIKMIDSVKSPYRTNTNNIILGSIVLDNANLYSKNIKYIIKEKNRVYKELKNIKNIEVYKSDANFILFKCQKELFAFLEKNKIIVRKFVINDEFYIRLTIGFVEENNLVLKKIGEFYA